MILTREMMEHADRTYRYNIGHIDIYIYICIYMYIYIYVYIYIWAVYLWRIHVYIYHMITNLIFFSVCPQLKYFTPEVAEHDD